MEQKENNFFRKYYRRGKTLRRKHRIKLKILSYRTPAVHTSFNESNPSSINSQITLLTVADKIETMTSDFLRFGLFFHHIKELERTFDVKTHCCHIEFENKCMTALGIAG